MWEEMAYLFQVDVVEQFHVLCVDAEDLQAPGCIRDTNVHLSVKPTYTHPETHLYKQVHRLRQKHKAADKLSQVTRSLKSSHSVSQLNQVTQSTQSSHSVNQLNQVTQSIDSPNLLRAPSMLLGRLVAAMTMTWALCFSPSIRVSNCETIRLSTSPWVYRDRDISVYRHTSRLS